MGWDSARVGAAIPSGVGFLGAGLIWKTTKSVSNGLQGNTEIQEVHGLTTAAGLWLSAALGMGAGGGLYIVSSYAVALVILILRVGPRMAGVIPEDSVCNFTSMDNMEGIDSDGWDTESESRNGIIEEKDGGFLNREEKRWLEEHESSFRSIRVHEQKEDNSPVRSLGSGDLLQEEVVPVGETGTSVKRPHLGRRKKSWSVLVD